MKNQSPNRRASGMTLLELTVVILVMLSLVSILFIGGRAWKRGSDRASCIMNIRNTQQAVRSYQNLNNLPYGGPLDVPGDLIGTGNFIEVAPVCPGSGNYGYTLTMPNVGTLAMTCSLAASQNHQPTSFTGW